MIVDGNTFSSLSTLVGDVRGKIDENVLRKSDHWPADCSRSFNCMTCYLLLSRYRRPKSFSFLSPENVRRSWSFLPVKQKPNHLYPKISVFLSFAICRTILCHCVICLKGYNEHELKTSVKRIKNNIPGNKIWISFWRSDLKESWSSGWDMKESWENSGVAKLCKRNWDPTFSPFSFLTSPDVFWFNLT